MEWTPPDGWGWVARKGRSQQKTGQRGEKQPFGVRKDFKTVVEKEQIY